MTPSVWIAIVLNVFVFLFSQTLELTKFRTPELPPYHFGHHLPFPHPRETPCLHNVFGITGKIGKIGIYFLVSYFPLGSFSPPQSRDPQAGQKTPLPRSGLSPFWTPYTLILDTIHPHFGQPPRTLFFFSHSSRYSHSSQYFPLEGCPAFAGLQPVPIPVTIPPLRDNPPKTILDSLDTCVQNRFLAQRHPAVAGLTRKLAGHKGNPFSPMFILDSPLYPVFTTLAL